MYAATRHKEWKNTKKKSRTDSELKLICFLLIAGNVIALNKAGFISISLFGYLLEFITVVAALGVIAKYMLSLIKHLKTA